MFSKKDVHLSAKALLTRRRWQKFLPGKALQYLNDILPLFAWEGITISQHDYSQGRNNQHLFFDNIKITSDIFRLARQSLRSSWAWGSIERVKTHDWGFCNAIILELSFNYLFVVTVAYFWITHGIDYSISAPSCFGAYFRSPAQIFICSSFILC